MQVECPGCGTEFKAARPSEGSWLRCPECGFAFRDRDATEPSAASGTADRIQPGDNVGGFRILERIGSGAMGDVYKALQLSLDRVVVLKVLPPAFADRPVFVQRFHEESTALSALNHPNVVTIYERGNVGKVFFFAMEYVDGVPLSRHDWDRSDVQQFVSVAIGLVSALEYAHERGVVHRDIKPANIMLSSRNEVKVTDFGLAGLMREARAKLRSATVTAVGGRALQMGTPNYMSPEQKLDPEGVDGRSDIFSTGVLLYELAAGSRPDLPVRRGPSEVCELADPRLDEMILRCLQEDPSKRYQAADELLAELQEVAHELERAPRCPDCGRLNPVRCEVCIQCGANLDDQFDVCPECRSKNRRDVRRCLYCGVDLERGRTLISEKVSMMLDRADELRLDGSFAEALEILTEVGTIEGRVFESERKRAASMRQKTIEDRQKAAEKAVQEAERMVGEQRLREAVNCLRSVPPEVQDTSERIREIQRIQARLIAERKSDATMNLILLSIGVIVVLLIVALTLLS